MTATFRKTPQLNFVLEYVWQGDLWDDARVKPLVACGLFDFVSCQFALHYSFESEQRARGLLSNVATRLKQHGYFVCTVPNAHWIVKRLRTTPGLSFGNAVIQFFLFIKKYERKNMIFFFCFLFCQFVVSTIKQNFFYIYLHLSQLYNIKVRAPKNVDNFPAFGAEYTFSLDVRSKFFIIFSHNLFGCLFVCFFIKILCDITFLLLLQ